MIRRNLNRKWMHETPKDVGLGSIVEVKKGEDGGFSVKYRDGSRGFFVGEVGEEIWRRWQEQHEANQMR